jgi:hypothetical protein
VASVLLTDSPMAATEGAGIRGRVTEKPSQCVSAEALSPTGTMPPPPSMGLVRPHLNLSPLLARKPLLHLGPPCNVVEG